MIPVREITGNAEHFTGWTELKRDPPDNSRREWVRALVLNQIVAIRANGPRQRSARSAGRWLCGTNQFVSSIGLFSLSLFSRSCQSVLAAARTKAASSVLKRGASS
jgi:hypothetical protein